MRRIAVYVLGLIALIGMPNFAGATGVIVGSSLAGDQVYGQWEDPIFVGTLLDGATGAVYPPGIVNTSGTASYSLGSTTPASPTTITWGADTCPCSAPPSSSVTFTGDVIPAGYGSTDFPIGSFNYTNGTSLNGTEIFGATLVLYAVDGVLGNIPIGSIGFRFTATVNDGTPAQNADYLNVDGISGSFNVLEGATASASLYGIIDGFEPAYFQLDPNQSGGFIGTNLPSPIPEPSTWAMLLVGFAGLGFAGYRNARRTGVAAA
ncbi:MAG: choice-of-anchor K domain-containing protein [Roseiarcus sp.]|uniref:choice-of-anchor K domain-containing protein n=2 Tax=Roseiarcus sp. TaxID=1969460 RepID=UPI003BB136DF